ncbi:hypothetical protein KR222_008313, partial [Zaprionus bogoriensis]
QFSPAFRPICLPFGDNAKDELHDDYLFTIAGWGKTENQYDVLAKRAAVITMMNLNECRKHFRVNENFICAVSAGKNSCNGDSGGPLMRQFKRKQMVIEGIVSYGVSNCSNTDIPGVYTRVRNYGDWMKEKMKM